VSVGQLKEEKEMEKQIDLIKVEKDTIRVRSGLAKKLRIAMCLGLIGGPIVSAMGFYQFKEMKSLAAKGTRVTADVIECSVLNTGKGRRVYKVVADYKVSEALIGRKEFIVQQDEYDAATATKKIDITFLPNKPEVSSAGKTIRPDTEMMAIGGGVFVFGVIAFSYFRRKDREIERAIKGEI
jgi:hypothetical protein